MLLEASYSHRAVHFVNWSRSGFNSLSAVLSISFVMSRNGHWGRGHFILPIYIHELNSIPFTFPTGDPERPTAGRRLGIGRSAAPIPIAAHDFSLLPKVLAHPASYLMGIVFLSRGRSSRGVTLTPTPSSAVVSERTELYLYCHMCVHDRL